MAQFHGDEDIYLSRASRTKACLQTRKRSSSTRLENTAKDDHKGTQNESLKRKLEER